MALDTTPRMLADPVAGFFAGVNSILLRLLIGWAGILAGYVLCSFSALGWDVQNIAGFPLGSIFMIFGWADRGGWFVIGMASLISIFAGLWSFVNGSNGKVSFFLIFTASVVYFAPFTFSSSRNIYDEERHPVEWALLIYATMAVCYWVVPWVILKIANRGAED